MPSKVGPYGKATLGKSRSPLSGPSRPSYVKEQSAGGKGTGPYTRSTLGTPGGQKPAAHVKAASFERPRRRIVQQIDLGKLQHPAVQESDR